VNPASVTDKPIIKNKNTESLTYSVGYIGLVDFLAENKLSGLDKGESMEKFNQQEEDIVSKFLNDKMIDRAIDYGEDVDEGELIKYGYVNNNEFLDEISRLWSLGVNLHLPENKRKLIEPYRKSLKSISTLATKQHSGSKLIATTKEMLQNAIDATVLALDPTIDPIGRFGNGAKAMIGILNQPGEHILYNSAVLSEDGSIEHKRLLIYQLGTNIEDIIVSEDKAFIEQKLGLILEDREQGTGVVIKTNNEDLSTQTLEASKIFKYNPNIGIEGGTDQGPIEIFNPDSKQFQPTIKLNQSGGSISIEDFGNGFHPVNVLGGSDKNSTKRNQVKFQKDSRGFVDPTEESTITMILQDTVVCYESLPQVVRDLYIPETLTQGIVFDNKSYIETSEMRGNWIITPYTLSSLYNSFDTLIDNSTNQAVILNTLYLWLTNLENNKKNQLQPLITLLKQKSLQLVTNHQGLTIPNTIEFQQFKALGDVQFLHPDLIKEYNPSKIEGSTIYDYSNGYTVWSVPMTDSSTVIKSRLSDLKIDDLKDLRLGKTVKQLGLLRVMKIDSGPNPQIWVDQGVLDYIRESEAKIESDPGNQQLILEYDLLIWNINSLLNDIGTSYAPPEEFINYFPSYTSKVKEKSASQAGINAIGNSETLTALESKYSIKSKTNLALLNRRMDQLMPDQQHQYIEPTVPLIDNPSFDAKILDYQNKEIAITFATVEDLIFITIKLLPNLEVRSEVKLDSPAYSVFKELIIHPQSLTLTPELESYIGQSINSQNPPLDTKIIQLLDIKPEMYNSETSNRTKTVSTSDRDVYSNLIRSKAYDNKILFIQGKNRLEFIILDETIEIVNYNMYSQRSIKFILTHLEMKKLINFDQFVEAFTEPKFIYNIKGLDTLEEVRPISATIELMHQIQSKQSVEVMEPNQFYAQGVTFEEDGFAVEYHDDNIRFVKTDTSLDISYVSASGEITRNMKIRFENVEEHNYLLQKSPNYRNNLEILKFYEFVSEKKLNQVNFRNTFKPDFDFQFLVMNFVEPTLEFNSPVFEMVKPIDINTLPPNQVSMNYQKVMNDKGFELHIMSSDFCVTYERNSEHAMFEQIKIVNSYGTRYLDLDMHLSSFEQFFEPLLSNQLIGNGQKTMTKELYDYFRNLDSNDHYGDNLNEFLGNNPDSNIIESEQKEEYYRSYVEVKNSNLYSFKIGHQALYSAEFTVNVDDETLEIYNPKFPDLEFRLSDLKVDMQDLIFLFKDIGDVYSDKSLIIPTQYLQLMSQAVTPGWNKDIFETIVNYNIGLNRTANNQNLDYSQEEKSEILDQQTKALGGIEQKFDEMGIGSLNSEKTISKIISKHTISNLEEYESNLRSVLELLDTERKKGGDILADYMYELRYLLRSNNIYTFGKELLTIQLTIKASSPEKILGLKDLLPTLTIPLSTTDKDLVLFYLSLDKPCAIDRLKQMFEYKKSILAMTNNEIYKAQIEALFVSGYVIPPTDLFVIIDNLNRINDDNPDAAQEILDLLLAKKKYNKRKKEYYSLFESHFTFKDIDPADQYILRFLTTPNATFLGKNKLERVATTPVTEVAVKEGTSIGEIALAGKTFKSPTDYSPDMLNQNVKSSSKDKVVKAIDQEYQSLATLQTTSDTYFTVVREQFQNSKDASYKKPGKTTIQFNQELVSNNQLVDLNLDPSKEYLRTQFQDDATGIPDFLLKYFNPLESSKDSGDSTSAGAFGCGAITINSIADKYEIVTRQRGEDLGTRIIVEVIKEGTKVVGTKVLKLESVQTEFVGFSVDMFSEVTKDYIPEIKALISSSSLIDLSELERASNPNLIVSINGEVQKPNKLIKKVFQSPNLELVSGVKDGYWVKNLYVTEFNHHQNQFEHPLPPFISSILTKQNLSVSYQNKIDLIRTRNAFSQTGEKQAFQILAKELLTYMASEMFKGKVVDIPSLDQNLSSAYRNYESQGMQLLAEKLMGEQEIDYKVFDNLSNNQWISLMMYMKCDSGGAGKQSCLMDQFEAMEILRRASANYDLSNAEGRESKLQEIMTNLPKEVRERIEALEQSELTKTYGSLNLDNYFDLNMTSQERESQETILSQDDLNTNFNLPYQRRQRLLFEQMFAQLTQGLPQLEGKNLKFEIQWVQRTGGTDYEGKIVGDRVICKYNINNITNNLENLTNQELIDRTYNVLVHELAHTLEKIAGKYNSGRDTSHNDFFKEMMRLNFARLLNKV
jgi:hypothetical protein